MFEALFKNRKKVKASSLQYKFADTVQVVKDDIKYDYKKNIYATSSKVARIVSFVLLQLPICLFAFIMMIFSPDWDLKSDPSIDGVGIVFYRNVSCMSQCR